MLEERLSLDELLRELASDVRTLGDILFQVVERHLIVPCGVRARHIHLFILIALRASHELSLAHAPTGLEFTVSRGTGAFIAHSGMVPASMP